MAKYRSSLQQISDRPYLSYVGMETDLIFNRGVDLPNFAAYPMVETESGRTLLIEYFNSMINLATRYEVGVMLESPTWMANRDRGGSLGHTPDRIMTANIAAIAMMSKIRSNNNDLPTILSAQVGPRGDAYAPNKRMSIGEAATYHAEQIRTLTSTDADIISAFTLCYTEEAAGIALAAKSCDMPVAISFTVETDGKLPTGMTLSEAIETVDQATSNYPEYYLVNCAHPEHLAGALKNETWMKRLNGVVANASRCSHAELDEAEVLDDGNPLQLGRQLGDIKRRFPHLTIFGGCCGTDLRHMTAIAENITE